MDRARKRSNSEESTITTSSSFAESSVDENRAPTGGRTLRKLLFRNETSLRSGDQPDIDTERELTPGSLDVWLDLPDEIKFDPMLAPFKHLYEQQHGRLEPTEQSTPVQSDTAFNKRENHLSPIGEASPVSPYTHTGQSQLNHDEDEKKEKTAEMSQRQKTLSKVYQVMKLGCLVACWLLLTTALLLNQERTEVVLHTAVTADTVKVCDLPTSKTGDRAKVFVELKGPFQPVESVDNASAAHALYLWLHMTSAAGDAQTWEQNSTKWRILLVPDSDMDFSASETRTQLLKIDSGDPLARTLTRARGGQANDSTLSLRLHTSSKVVVPLTVSYQTDPLDPQQGIIYAAILLCGLYVLIIFEVVNRTLAALLSSSLGVAVLALGGSRPTLPDLVSWLDVETLLLLFSMMLLVAILAETGLFDYLAVVAFEVTGGSTWPLINCLCLFTAVMSTFLDNVTTVLLMTPVTIRLCEVMQLNPVPVLLSMVVFSNVGGAATPVGDPPNVIIASHPAVTGSGINFVTFTVHMGVGILFVCVQTYIQLRFMFRDVSKLRHSVPGDIQEMRQEIAVWRRAAGSLSSYSRDEELVRKALQKKVEKLGAALARREAGGGAGSSDPVYCATLAHMKQKYGIRDRPLLIKATICVSFVVVVFFLHAIPELQRLSLGWTALLGALLLLLLADREDLEPILARVEWSTLLFFAALFVLMEALSKLGLIEWIGSWTESIILKVGEESRLAVAILLVLWVSGLASAFVDNIPLTTMMIRVTTALGDSGDLALPLQPLIWALSFGACLGGNGTLIGASANVVCAGVAEQHGYRFTFMQFLKVGFPIMLGNLAVASVYLLVAHCLFEWH